MNRKFGLMVIVLASLVLTACASKDTGGVVDTTPTQTAPAVDPNANNAFGTGYSAADLSSMNINGNPLNYTTVYFEYNSTAIDTRSEVIARAHARELVNRGGASVSLEGHADERGTRDYNLALGERRSQQVAALMNNEGAGGSSITSVSYGEERPANPAHGEAAWLANRRVEIKY
ncbi:MAG: peptidoglycan-associated lipoprotein [Cryomorphaceae bacterium]|jgi:peptidoglycan-associated lipoprotein